MKYDIRINERKEKNMKKILLTIVLTMVICMFGITAYAADEPLTLDIEDGAITITETGYIQDGITEIPYTGSYIITGTTAEGQDYNSITINGIADGQTITLKDLEITTSGPYPLSINGDIEVEATGTISLSGISIALSVDGNLTVIGDADIALTGNYAYGINGNGDINITCNSLEVKNASMSSPAVYGNLIANVTNDIVMAGGLGIAGNADITSGGDVTITCANSNAVTGALIADVDGDLTITGNSSTSSLISNGAELTVGGDVELINEVGQVINNGLEANIGGSFRVVGTCGGPTIGSNYDVNITAGSIEIENEGTGQVISTIGYADNPKTTIVATNGDISLKANTTSGGTLTMDSTLTALNGDITVVNTGDTFVVSNNLTATAKNIYVRGAGTFNPPASGKMILVAEEDVEIVTNSGKLSYPGSEPDLKYGGSVSVNDGTYTLEIEIAESKIEYNGESQQPELTVLVDGTVINSEDYIIEYYDESGTSIDEFVELGIYKMVIRGANASWTLYGTFEIVAKDITDAVITVENDTFTYNGEEQSVVIESVVIDGITLSESDYQVSGDKATDAGEYELRVTAAEGSNFVGTATLRYVIEEVEDNSGNEPGDEPGDEPSDEPSDKPGDDAGNNAGNNTDNNSGSNAGNNTDNNSGSNAGNNTGNNSGNNAGNNTGSNTGNNAENNTGNNAGNNGGSNAGNNAGNNSGSSVGNNAGNNSGSNAGNNVGSNSGSDAGNNAGNNASNNTENKAPNAGDNANVGIMMIISVVAMMCVVVSQKKKVNQN